MKCNSWWHRTNRNCQSQIVANNNNNNVCQRIETRSELVQTIVQYEKFPPTKVARMDSSVDGYLGGAHLHSGRHFAHCNWRRIHLHGDHESNIWARIHQLYPVEGQSNMFADSVPLAGTFQLLLATTRLFLLVQISSRARSPRECLCVLCTV